MPCVNLNGNDSMDPQKKSQWCWLFRINSKNDFLKWNCVCREIHTFTCGLSVYIFCWATVSCSSSSFSKLTQIWVLQKKRNKSFLLTDIQEFYEVTLLDNQRCGESVKVPVAIPPVNLWDFSSIQSTTVTSDTLPSLSTSIEVSVLQFLIIWIWLLNRAPIYFLGQIDALFKICMSFVVCKHISSISQTSQCKNIWMFFFFFLKKFRKWHAACFSHVMKQSCHNMVI